MKSRMEFAVVETKTAVLRGWHQELYPGPSRAVNDSLDRSYSCMSIHWYDKEQRSERKASENDTESPSSVVESNQDQGHRGRH